MSTLMEAALQYARRGWRVIPLHHVGEDGHCSCGKAECGSPGKHPRTANGLKDGTVAESTIRRWWDRWPLANIAVCTGPESGVWMLGPDGEKGKADLAALEEEHCELPQTPTARSGGGGQHRLFRWPAEGTVGNDKNHRKTAIDIRGAGGYFVAAPSRNGAGPYSWEISPDACELPEAPGWLLEWCRSKEEKKSTLILTATGGGPSVEERCIMYLAKLPDSIMGEKGSDRLFYACRVAVYRFDLGVEHGYQIIQAYYNREPRCRPVWTEKEVRHKCEDADSKPFDKPRGDLLGYDKDGLLREIFSASASVPDGESIIIRASEITRKDVEWLWPGRIPLCKLTTFAGPGGLGKTFVLCAISSIVSSGGEWPYSGGELCKPGQVIFISGEDDADDTLVPRMFELGADLSKIVFLKTEVLDRFTLADLKTLDRAVKETGEDVKLVCIDPPTCYLGNVNDHKNAELRALLSPLKNWTHRNKLATIFNTHVSKPSGQKVEAIMRIMGSVAWANAVRGAHMFCRDPNDPERRLFVPAKFNLGKEPKALAYRIVKTDMLARVEWCGEVDVTADEAMNKEKRKKRGVVAAEWLAEIFNGKDEVDSNLIWKGKEATDLSRNAILEAKDDMGIKAKQVTDPEMGQHWVWYWPRINREAWTEHQRRMAEQGSDQGTI